MPTVIDSLLVQLSIDASKFKADADKTQTTIGAVGRTAVQSSKGLEDNLQKAQAATGKRLKQTEEVGRGAAQQFNKFRVEVAGLFATLATGFGFQKFMDNVAKGGADLGRTSVQLGISTEKLNAWQEAAKRVGGSSEGITSAFKSMTQDFQDRQITGQSSMLAYLQRLNVEWADASDPTKMRPIEDIYKDIAKSPIFQKMEMPEAINVGAKLGMDAGTVALLKLGGDELEKLLGHVSKFGLLTKEQANALIAYQNALNDLEQSFTTLGRVIAVAASKPLTEFIDQITNWINNPANQKFVSDELVAGIKTFGETIVHIIGFINEWKGAAEALAEYITVTWVARMVLGLGPLSTAIAAITAGFLAIQQATKFFDPSQYSKNSPFWMGVSKEEQLKYPDSPESRKARGEPERDAGSVDWQDPRTWFGGHGRATDERKASVRDRLSTDLGISKEAASGIVSNLNAESGIAGINERNPIVPGSRGGFGWAQWTGDRRLDFEQFAGSRGLNPASDKANYDFLIQELTTKYPQVLAKLKTGGISAKGAAEIVARGYIIPPESSMAGHIAGAEDIARIDPKKPGGMEGLKEGMPDILRPYTKWITGSTQTPPGAARVAANTNTNSTVETNINGPITINTQAKDADGIANSLADRVKKVSFAAPMDRGLA